MSGDGGSVTSERKSKGSDLDLYSCLHFLLELYGQLLSADSAPGVPLMQLNQTIQSVSYLFSPHLPKLLKTTL